MELDGLRAIAIMLVMCEHGGVPFVPGGSVGVDVFFALSGFLITSIIVKEWGRDRSVRLCRFYMNRVLRLVPALVVVTLAVYLFVQLVLPTNPYITPPTTSGLPYVWGYIGNWREAIHAHSGGLGLLSHAWSLAVEEQFYILWPIALVLLLRRGVDRRRLAVGTVGLASCLLGWGIVVSVLPINGGVYARTYFGSDTHSAGLMLGCALALWLSIPHRQLRFRVPLFLGGATLVVYLALNLNQSQWAPAPTFFLASLGTCMMIAAIVEGTPRGVTATLGSRPVSYVGRISYGVYLWHYPMYYGLAWLPFFYGHAHAGWFWIIKGTAPLAVAALSYRFVEQPFLALKTRGALPTPDPLLLAETIQSP